jgi:hypothetical protein
MSEATFEDLVGDAMQLLWNASPSRRGEIEQWLRACGRWHNHDVDRECCTLSCPADKVGQCAACGQELPFHGGRP